LVKYQEFFDDHQKELAGNLGKEGILIYLENTDNLIEAIEDSEGFIPDFQKLLSDDFLFKRILNDII
ncbi:MAG: hypothetical protein HOJ35_05225, partial [Bdellovibrionales bacterium]|nr:hypothetical protein [Bdellovibrionales bacterium]